MSALAFVIPNSQSLIPNFGAPLAPSPDGDLLVNDAELIVGARLTDMIVVEPLRRGVPGAVLAGLEL